MKHSLFRAFLLFPLLLCVACSNMGMGSDPAIVEGVFSFLLPSAIDLQAAEPAPAGGEDEDASLENAPAGEGDEDASLENAPAGEGEDEGVDVAEPAPSTEGDEDASLENAPAGEGEDAESESFAVPPAAVSRWYLSLVSAMGFERHEIVAPSEQPVLLAVQAGQWKILVIAEDSEGRMIARCELNGISLSPEEEKPVPLEWQLPAAL